MEKRSVKIIVFFATMIPAILLIFLGVRLKIRTFGMPSTTAVISRFEEEIKPGHNGIKLSDRNVTRWVVFELDGEIYEVPTDTYSSSDCEGDEIKIYYNPDNLTMAYADDGTNVFFVCLGIFTAIVGLLLVFGKSPAEKKVTKK